MMRLFLIIVVYFTSSISTTYAQKGHEDVNLTQKHHLSLQMQDGYHFCSAALVVSQYGDPKFGQIGITAATCFQHRIYPIYAVAGVTDLNDLNSTGVYEKRLVTRIEAHPNFKPKHFLNNIAVIFFESDFVKASPIPYYYGRHYGYAGEPIIVSGFGTMYAGAKNANRLQVLETVIAIEEFCREIVRTFLPDGTKFEGYEDVSMECFEGPIRNSKLGPCIADAGAPVIEGNGTFTLIGIVLYGHDCFYPEDRHVILTDVSWFSDKFIQGLHKYP